MLLVKFQVLCYNVSIFILGGIGMEMQDILKQLRENNNLTQEQMAKRLMVTRQAVSRWENGETQPNTDTLKLLSCQLTHYLGLRAS